MSDDYLHVGIILDGNRRYAKQRFQLPWKGHRAGYEKVKQCFSWCLDLDVKELTLYCFSTENFNRPQKEVSKLMGLMKKGAEEILKGGDVHKNEVRINAVGRLDMLPDPVSDAFQNVADKTRDYGNLVVNLCIAYGGRAEIEDAAKKAMHDAIRKGTDLSKLADGFLKEYLMVQNDPDFIIRTGGDIRLSNFLPYQAAYSELFFVNKFWPEFEKTDLEEIIKKFKKRQRRFGK